MTDRIHLSRESVILGGDGFPEITWGQVIDKAQEDAKRIATLERQLAEREKTEQDLWEKLNCQDNEIDDLKRQLEEAQEKEKAAKDLISEVMFNHQSPDHPSYNGCEEGDCAWCGYARQSGLIDEGWFTVKDSTAGEPE
jgi:uncharacterized coiled-coil protein SlyX